MHAFDAQSTHEKEIQMAKKHTEKSSNKLEGKDPNNHRESAKSDPSDKGKGNDPKSKTNDSDKGQSSQSSQSSRSKSDDSHRNTHKA